ncbi:MAG TPA: acyltransferase family protein [Acidimicrobiia bacterium]|nr:acyltransferase family protein [Acidimicrobiia bacterium]
MLETRERELSSPPARSTASPLGYQPALDGLRALAVGAVLLYHGGVSWSSGGFLGVDVFFVLSGFLITSLLVTEFQRTGGIAVISFYGRRLRRLLPALLLMLGAVLVYAITIAPTSQLRDLRSDILATLGYVTNWRLIAANHGYFDAFAAPSPLKHTWSLAVEEQWYLIWPIVVVGLLKLTRERGRRLGLAIGVTAVACGVSTLAMILQYSPGTDPSRVYYGTDTRAQELLTGALLALVCAQVGHYRVSRRWKPAVVVAGFAALVAVLVLCAQVNDSTTWLYEGGLLLFSFVVSMVIFAAIQPNNVVRDLLSFRWLRWIGAISYGLYLWHWPIYVVVNPDRMGLEGTPLLIVRLAITFAAAAASYYLVELPIRHGNLSRRVTLVAAPALIVGIVVTTFVVTSGARPVADSSLAAALGTAQQGASATTTTLVPADPGALRMGVVGDSEALQLALGFDPNAGPHGVAVSEHTMVGCPLFEGDQIIDGKPVRFNECADWRATRPSWLAEANPEIVVVMSAVWDAYDRQLDGGVTLTFGTSEFDRWFSDGLDRTLTELSAGGRRVAILTAPCNDRHDRINGPPPPENQPERIAHLNGLYRAAARRHADVASVIDLNGFLCPGGEFDADMRAEDGVHFSDAGVRAVSDWLAPQLDELARG